MNFNQMENDRRVFDDILTAFVVGNGASLKAFDFSQLQACDWVGMNAAYRYWEQTGYYPTYYACLDLIVGASHIDAIVDMVTRADTLKIKSFLLRDDLISKSEALQSSPRVVNFDKYFEAKPERILDLVTTGSHSALWMHELGYAQIILLGIDVNYVEHVAGAKSADGDVIPHKLTIIREAENTNYFIPDYQQVDDSYTVPNPEPDVHKAAWRRIRTYIDRTDQPSCLYNGSSISELDCIDFINMSDFLSDGHSRIETVREHMEKRVITGQDEAGLLCRMTGSLTPTSLSYFLQELLPIHYGNILMDGGEHAALFPGWASSAFAPDRITPWSGVYLTAESYLSRAAEIRSSGFVVMAANTPELTERVIDNLFMDFDSLYGMTKLDDEVQICQYPAARGGAPDYILAFARQRFWDHTIEEALRSVMSPILGKAEVDFKRGLRKRRLRFRIKSLKSKFGL